MFSHLFISGCVELDAGIAALFKDCGGGLEGVEEVDCVLLDC